MLAADKLLLESRIARGAVQLKWKEFGLHHLNLTTVGTQAAVMAGFSITALIEFAPSPDANRALLFLFWTSNMVSLACNILCVATTTMLSVYGSSLSTRGADGSMVRAVDGLYALRRRVFALFWAGVVSVLVASVFGVWILFGGPEATFLTVVLVATIAALIRAKIHVASLFRFALRDTETRDAETRVSMSLKASKSTPLEPRRLGSTEFGHCLWAPSTARIVP